MRRGLVSDRQLSFAVARLRRPWLTPPVIRYSRLGNNGMLWVGWGALRALRQRRPRLLIRTAAVTWSALAANYAIKLVARRSRPAGGLPPALIKEPASSSFPSAHATMSAAAAITLGGWAPLAAAPMMLSRIYLGVHYPSDVAAGALLGTVWGVVTRRIEH